MAAKRTGRIFSSPWEKKWFKKSIFVLELLGRPFYWFLVGSGLGLFLLLDKIVSFFFRFFPLLHRLSRPKKILRLKLAGFKTRLFPFKKRPLSLRTRKIFFGTGLFLLVFSFGSHWAYINFFKDLPHPEKLLTRQPLLTTKIYDRQGQLLYKIYRQQNRTLVKLEKIPASLIEATIAIEDAEFYHHPGFSVKGIVRAFLKNLQGDQLYGGSTITQQLVKNTLLSPQRTWQRKLKELILAFQVERKFQKNEILQMYLNEVGYGGAAYGAEEAAQKYFGKSVQDLDLAESALLAGLPAAPTAYSPFGAHPEKAKERQILVLKRMREERFITAKQEETARLQKIELAPQKTDLLAPHFVLYVKDLLVEKFGQLMVEGGGLEVKTSLDWGLQQMAQTIVSQEVAKLKNLKVSNGAALITLPASGEILAMVGSNDYFDLENDGNVNVDLRPRQPGSAIKPVNYSVALENGFTAATIIPDTPITYRLPGQDPYSPRNYDGHFHGHLPLRTALASSYNVPAVKVLSALGVEKMVERGRAMGITTWEDSSRFGLSLTLGGGEVKMIDLAVVYGTLANLGTRVDLNPILAVKNYQGEILEKRETKNQKVFSPNVAYLLTDILADNQARAPAFGIHSLLKIPGRPHVAVKTGTTQNLRDNWTIGFSPDFLVAVWVGNNDNTPMSKVASGVTGASPIWHQMMKSLIENLPDRAFPKPETLIEVEICAITGTLPCQGCLTKTEFFIPGTEPKTHCDPEKFKKPPATDQILEGLTTQN